MSCDSLSLWFVVVSVLACASSFFTPAPFPLVCVVSSMPMCHHPHPMCCGVCVLCEACHMHCVWWLALSNTLPCCAPSSLLFSFCPSLFHHHHPQTNTGVWREEREKGVDGEREEEEEERCDAKTSGEKGAKREKEMTAPGVPRLSPTRVLTRPEQASLH